MSILITLLVALIVIGLLFWLVGMLPIAEPFGMAVRIVLVAIALIWILTHFKII